MAQGTLAKLKPSLAITATSVHGCVTLRFDSLRPYAFVSQAQWPASDNYEAAIRGAVEETLCEYQGHTNSTHVVLVRIEWDEVASCEIGFRKAAAAATRAAFEV
ncbi:hypothetical protein NLM33_22770 [Bradyrhizobium sp. CCGUVB1N3]|uniref:hypothetical protein n=1 Tax=Bradyrhizobium sp. CCGUVB1N3 TaxID=2949629 RepID=UPI0020B29610|nr:hypothetical protein [Bradyrhizobium sp. CCGUVB1N3]MCP3473144.1 hypothetical protein [Bradyrhizobium sp. CCGUVB1N3]